MGAVPCAMGGSVLTALIRSGTIHVSGNFAGRLKGESYVLIIFLQVIINWSLQSAHSCTADLNFVIIPSSHRGSVLIYILLDGEVLYD